MNKVKNMNLRTIKDYHDNGKPFQEYTVDEEGQKHGTYRNWYDNGQIFEQCEYVNGHYHGTRQRWHNNGQLWSQSEWVNGKRHGTYRDWHDNGQLYSQTEHVNGARHGIRYLWNNDGSLRYIEQNDNDKSLVRVDYTINPIMIRIIDPNIDSTTIIANITSSLDEQGKKYEFTNN